MEDSKSCTNNFLEPQLNNWHTNQMNLYAEFFVLTLFNNNVLAIKWKKNPVHFSYKNSTKDIKTTVFFIVFLNES